ncbi:hypothetical protein ACFQEP_00830 [Lactococcus lactis subsp. hordniae]
MKAFGKQLKDSFKNNFGGRDQADFNEHWDHFSDEMKNRFGDFDGNRRPDFDSKPKTDKNKEPKKPENWDDF